MPDARTMLKNKIDRPLTTIDPDASVLQAANLMNDERIGSLLVVSDDALVGIFTERDILQRVVAARRDPEATTVREVMTAEVVWATPDTPREELSITMQEKRIRHVPVVESGALIGLISIGDLNRSENREQAQTIRYLEQFISVG